MTLRFLKSGRSAGRRVSATVRSRHPLLAMGCVLLAAGCAVGPNFQRPSAPKTEGYQPEPLPVTTASPEMRPADVQRFVQGMDIPGQWWTLFHSETLNALIEDAIQHNPDTKAAQAALRAAWETVAAQRGAYFPTVDANINPTRQKIAGALTSPLASGGNLYSLTTGQVSISYVPDLFGANRRQVETLVAQAQAQRFQLEATYLTLTSNVVNGAVQEAALRAQIVATRHIIDAQAIMLDSFRRQYALGQVADTDLAAQEAALAQTQATLPPLEKQLALQSDQLVALMGRLPSEKLDATFELSSLQLPRDLPVSLPSALVEQRPDIQAAEEELHAASAQIGVAIANRLPNIEIDASLGNAATMASQLFTAGSEFWNLSANVTQPIFEGGTLMHRQRAAEDAYDQAAAQYRSTVIAAFQNVADVLHAIQSDADTLRAEDKADRAAFRSLQIAKRQFDLGDISSLVLLNADQSFRQAEIALIQTQANRYADTVALFQALGGGWWNRDDVETLHKSTAVAKGVTQKSSK